MRTIQCYHPGRKFPAISITGNQCALKCPHCLAQPLRNMLHVEDPIALIELAHKIEENGGIGFLVSGGLNSDGALPISNFLSSISEIKETTDLKINAHIGYPHGRNIESIVQSGIDVFSINFPINDSIGKQVLKIDNAMERYIETVDSLLDAGTTKIIPHVLIGLGETEEEFAGIDYLAEKSLRSIVFLAFMPIKHTPLSKKAPTSSSRIITGVEYAREKMPDAFLVLGCMRPRGLLLAEQYLMENVIDGIVLPARSVREKISPQFKLDELNGCCSIYL